MFTEIHDVGDKSISVFASLTEAQLLSRAHPEKGLFIAESVKVIEYALSAGYEPTAFLMPDTDLPTYGEDYEQRYPDVPVYYANREVLSKLTGFDVTRSIMCAMKRRTLPEPHIICENSKKLVILEHITDPTNIGAIFRCAAALGMDGVLLSESCCNPLYRRCARVSMGTVFMIPWTIAKGKDGVCIDIAKEHGFFSAALCLSDKSVSLDEDVMSDKDKIALVFGSEGKGLSECTIQKCDISVMIPMQRGVDSLNVAAAAAVTFWHICSLKK